jgi:hypothetical protein
MTHPNRPVDYHHQGRKDRLIQEYEHDPYKAGAKPPEPTCCPKCNAVFHEGRWQWMERPGGAHESLCPACRRAREELPAGYLTLGGPYFEAHRDEVLHLVRHIERRENAEHPLDRILDITHTPGGETRVTFTDAHLARGVGEAIEHALHGEVKFHYTEEDPTLRVTWSR